MYRQSAGGHRSTSPEGETKVKKIAFVLAFLLAFASITPAFGFARVAGGGQIQSSVTYHMVDVASDGQYADIKSEDWLKSYCDFYGYRTRDGLTVSVITSGTITVVGLPADVVPQIVWSSAAPKTPTISFTQDASGRILSATITAHESVRYWSKRVTIKWQHHHHYHKRSKIVTFKTVFRDTSFWAPVPVIPSQS